MAVELDALGHMAAPALRRGRRLRRTDAAREPSPPCRRMRHARTLHPYLPPQRIKQGQP
jgi:hypothetical protein